MGTVGRKKRTGILKYHKHKSKDCGYISYPTQPDGRRPVEYLPGAYESGEMLEAYNKSVAHWLAEKTVPPWVGNKRRGRRRKVPARTLAELPDGQRHCRRVPGLYRRELQQGGSVVR